MLIASSVTDLFSEQEASNSGYKQPSWSALREKREERLKWNYSNVWEYKYINMCPPSSLPDCDVILEKFLLVSNLHCAGGGVITQSDLSVLVSLSLSISQFLLFHL